MNKAELELHADQTKKALYAEKEELFFAMDEKTHEADLTEKGRNYMRPEDPDAFVLPDLTVKFHEIDSGAGSRPAQAAGNESGRCRRNSRPRPCKSTPSPSCSRPTAFTNWTSITSSKTAKSSSWTSTPGGPCMAGAGATDCTRRSRPRKGVEIERETQTLATITIQNYFRLYKKLAGMTGTAETEAGEFLDIYKLGVMVIPTNKPVARTGRQRFGL